MSGNPTPHPLFSESPLSSLPSETNSEQSVHPETVTLAEELLGDFRGLFGSAPWTVDFDMSDGTGPGPAYERNNPHVILPARYSDKAPRFDRTIPGSLRRYIEDYEHIAAKAGMSVADKIKRFAMYMQPVESDYIATLTPYTEANNWENFIAAVYDSYPGSKEADRYSIEDLNSLCDKQAVRRIVTRTDFADFDRDFQRISHALKQQNIAGDSEIDRKYWAALDPSFRDRLKNRLEVRHPEHNSRIPWDRKDVRTIALKLLEIAPNSSGPGLNPTVPFSTEAASRDPTPVVKNEMEDLFSKLTLSITHSMETAVAHLANQVAAIEMRNPPYRPPPQRPPRPPFRPPPQMPSTRPSVNMGMNNRLAPPVRPEGVFFGPAGSRPRAVCYMCHNPGHFLSNCPVYRQYIEEGRIRRGEDGSIRLINGDRMWNDPNGSAWADRIDEFYKQNPQLVPSNAASPASGPEPANVQSNFISVFAVPEVTRVEDPEEQNAALLRTQLNGLITEVLTANRHERPAIEATINVLNARLQKKEEAIKTRARGKPAINDNSRSEPKGIRPTAQVPVVEIPSLPSKEKQPKPAPGLPVTGAAKPVPQFRYRAPVENEEMHKQVFDKIMAQNVVLTVEECLSSMPSLRKYFKDATTGKRVPTEEDKTAAFVEAPEREEISSFNLNVESQSNPFEAKPSLPLRCIEVLINDEVKSVGILDSGCQVILMRKDVWTQLKVPLHPQKVLSMESANGTRNFTAGLVPRVKFSIGPVNLWCSVQVVETAPFELLLGRPFTVLGQGISKDYFDGGMELVLMDPDSGEIVTIPTFARNDPRHPRTENVEPAKAPTLAKPDF